MTEVALEEEKELNRKGNVNEGVKSDAWPAEVAE